MTIYPLVVITTERLLLTKNEEKHSTRSHITTLAKVNGACEMCKERIEETAKNLAQLKAEWNAETLLLKLEFDQSKTSLDQILKDIANSKPRQ